MDENVRKKVSSLPNWWVLVAVVCFGLIISAVLYYQSEKDKIRSERYDAIVSVADVKARELEQWRVERLADVRVLSESPLARIAILELFKSPGDSKLRKMVQERLALERNLDLYENAFLMDTTGQLIISAGEINPIIDSSERALIRHVIAERKPVLSDLFSERDGKIRIDAMSAVLDKSGEPVAVVVLRSNAGDFLFPLLDKWPVLSRTAETLLIEKQGDAVVLLNSPRFSHGGALTMRIPLSYEADVAVQAALGKTGMFEGKDYRGIEVLADLRPIKNTPWSLIAKVDEDEIFSEASYRGGMVALIVILLVILSVAATAYAYRHREAGVYRNLYYAETEKRTIEQEYKATLYSIGDAVITTDTQGLVKDMNPVAEHLTGWKESEARGKPLDEVFHIVNELSRSAVESPIDRVLRDGVVVGLANHTLLISKDGTEYPIADSGSPIRDALGKVIGVVLVFRDQTKEREAEERFRLVFENAFDGIAIYAEDPDPSKRRLIDCNERYAAMAGRSREELLQIGYTLKLQRTLDETANASRLESIAEGKPFRGTYSWIRPDGRPNIVEYVGAPIKWRGNSLAIGIDRDITEQKSAEMALRESQQMLKTVLDTIPVRVFWKDKNGIFIGCNLPFAKDSGFDSPDEVVGKDDFQMSWNAQAEKYRADDREVIETGIPKLAYEEPQDSAKGRIWIRTSKVPLRNAEGEIIGVLGTYEDITDAKRTQLLLERERSLLNSVLENTIDSIFFKDTQGRFTRVSKATILKHDLTSEEEILGKTDFDFFDKARAQELYEQEQKVITTGKPLVDVEVEELWLDKAPTWVSVTKVPLRDERGQVVGVFGISRDITERKRAEQLLKESEEKFRGLVEGSASAIWIHDGKKFLYANPAALDMTGYTFEELSRLEVMEIIHPDFREFVMKRAMERLGDRQVPKHYEYQILKKSGEAIWIDFSGTKINYQGRPAIIASAYDITEKKKLEEQLVQAQKMEGIGRLAGGIAHDYNNMIGVILGYSQLMMKKLSKDSPVYRYAELIDSVSRRGADLTRQLLAFARREIVSPKAINPNEAIAALQKMLAKLIGEDIALKFFPEKDVWNIKIDPTQFDQILINLATNARDAITGAGTVIIETSNVVITEEYTHSRIGFSPGEYVLLSFSDNGIGIGKEFFDKIFEPFFTTKPKGQGTGLGLSTVYGIVKQNGGNINVYSEPGEGTTFKIYFPRYYGESAKRETEAEAMDVSGDETVLIVEDQAELLELAKNSLEEYGYKVLTALSPGEGILLCEAYQDEIHLLLTDVVMPTMNGKDLRDRIQEIKPKIKTLFMSGYTANVIAHRGVLEENIEFIQKPFTPHGLAKKVREVLDS
jgi:PAS domain S-box-containing protein